MDAAEEEYFNTSDEEDNAPTPKDSPIKGANGSGSPVPKPLVDYADDDPMDTADESKPEEKGGTATPTKPALEGASSASPTTSPTTLSPTSQKSDSDVLSGAPTPERLSEKRRREEEDDDELGKLRNKRRSPTCGSGSVNALTKKRSSGPGGSPPTKKIAINLAVKTSTGSSDGGGGGGDVAGGGGGEADDEK